MIRLPILVIIVTSIMLGACGGTPSCRETDFYKSAQQGQRVAVPDDLDELPDNRELRIPEPSEQVQRPANPGCIEAPPKLSS